MLFIIIGIMCILYFISIVGYIGLTSKFMLIWLVLGILAILIGIGFKLDFHIKYEGLKILKYILVAFIIVGSIFFIGVEGLIVKGFAEKAPEELDYIIVLGAKIRESGPSKILRERLDEAIIYLDNNPETLVVVSGGQGVDEPTTEAEGMETYLVEKGIGKERIIREDQSTSTYENLLYSKELLNSSENSVGIVSSNFHIFRATKIAEKLEYNHVYGIAAPSDKKLLAHNMLREFFGVSKDFLVGNL